MLIVQIDVIDAQALQAGVAGAAHVLWPAVDAEEGAVRAAHVAELGGDHDLVTAGAQDVRQQAFVGARDAVHVGGVEKIHADVDGAVDDVQ